MRGKVDYYYRLEEIARITPAHAGKSFYINGIYSQFQDHPRTCGEKCSAASALACSLGSPPHMRGKAEAAEDLLDKARITPAHAGKSDKMYSDEILD